MILAREKGETDSQKRAAEWKASAAALETRMGAVDKCLNGLTEWENRRADIMQGHREESIFCNGCDVFDLG